MENLNEIIGKKLLYLRKRNKLTQAELAEKLSTTPIAIERWENGETQPDLNDLILLSQALNVSTDHLCGKKNSLAVEGGRKSFRYEELDERFFLKETPGVFIPYLEALQKDLEIRD